MYEDDEHTRRTGKSRSRKAAGPSPSSGSRSARIRPAPDPRLSRSLEYGIAILESFSRKHQELGIAELAELVGISRSTTHRYAITLVALGYLGQDSRRKCSWRVRARSRCSSLAPAVGARSRST